MVGILYALITVLAWGTWLAPSQNVPLKNQQIRMFYVASANLLLASLISLGHGLEGLKAHGFWLPFVGGLIWAASGLCAFTATSKLGMAKAFGIWAPLNIIVSLVCGRVLFGEFKNPGPLKLLLLLLAVAVIIAGVLLIIFARGGTERPREPRAAVVGLLGALGAGILWGIYYIPIKMAGASMWIAALPMAVGIFVGSGILLLLGGQSPAMRGLGEYGRVSATGVLWSVGNYAMLLLVGELGAGKGYTIAQLSVVVNALVGIYALRDPRPGTRAASMTLLGCILATLGGILLGNLK
jgi:glucose uptake protein